MKIFSLIRMLDRISLNKNILIEFWFELVWFKFTCPIHILECSTRNDRGKNFGNMEESIPNRDQMFRFLFHPFRKQLLSSLYNFLDVGDRAVNKHASCIHETNERKRNKNKKVNVFFMSFIEKNWAYEKRLEMGCGRYFTTFIECQISPTDNVIFEQKLRSDRVNHMDHKGEKSATF